MFYLLIPGFPKVVFSGLWISKILRYTFVIFYNIALYDCTINIKKVSVALFPCTFICIKSNNCHTEGESRRNMDMCVWGIDIIWLVDLAQSLVMRKQNPPSVIVFVILWVYYTIPFGFSLFRYFAASLINFLNYFVWLMVSTRNAHLVHAVYQIRLKWCIHLNRSIFLYS